MDVEVTVLYSLKEIVYANGVLKFPKPIILSGYAGQKGQRGQAAYTPPRNLRFGGWNENMKRLITSSLAYEALGAAETHFLANEENKKFEEQFGAEFAKEVKRLQGQRIPGIRYP
jgi:hypothetical protein